MRELIPGRPPTETNSAARGAGAHRALAFLRAHLEAEHPATYDLLVRAGRPRCHPSREARTAAAGSVNAKRVSERVVALENSYLFIQGPPGSGKSTIGSQVICDLLQPGKRVAVTSTSHEAIHNLLHKVEECMADARNSFRGPLQAHASKTRTRSSAPSFMRR